MAIMHTLFTSSTLKRRCAMNVFVPEAPHKDGKPGFPVVYLLHGRSDDENSYADHGIRALCEKYQFITVMPDGGRSFYMDMHSGEKYWTFKGDEFEISCDVWNGFASDYCRKACGVVFVTEAEAQQARIVKYRELTGKELLK